MAAVASMALTFGALGLRQIQKHEEIQCVIKFGLSFFLPDKLVDGLFDKLKDREVLQEINKVGEKVDTLLGEAQTSSTQLLRDAFIAYENCNYSEAASLFKEVRQNAFKAFNQSNKLESWVACTQLKITGSYMSKSYDERKGMILFDNLAPEKQREIAQTIKGYLDDLLEKTEEKKKEIVEKAKKAAKFQAKKKMTEAKAKVQEIDDKVDEVLVRVYPLISQGLHWTEPKKTLTPIDESLSFDVFPVYIPEGKDDSVQVMVCKMPEIIVSLHRKLDFSYNTLDLIDGQILTWEINGTMHQQLVKGSDTQTMEPVCLTIPKEELEIIFRGGPKDPSHHHRGYTTHGHTGRRTTIHGRPQLTPSPSTPDLFAGSNGPGKQRVPEIESITEVVQANGSSPPSPDQDEDNGKAEGEATCAKCDKTIWNRQTHAFNKVYHPYCFRCTECDSKLVKVFHRHEKKPYCTKCYKGLDHWPKCFECGEGVIKGEKRVRAKGNLYHSRCFTCYACKRLLNSETGFFELDSGAIVCEDELDKRRLPPEGGTMTCDDCKTKLEGTYFHYGNKDLCEKDYEKYRKTCSVCDKQIAGTFYTDKDGKLICAKDYKEKHGSLNCLKCDRLIEGGEVVRAVGSLFHPDCFTCSVCAKNLSAKDTTFMTDDDKNLFCREDYHKKHSPKCASCHEPIAPKAGEDSAPRLKALDKDWHPTCFKCQDCQAKLGGTDGKKCFPLNNEIPLCLDCHKLRIAK